MYSRMPWLVEIGWIAMLATACGCEPGAEWELQWLQHPIYHGTPDTSQAHQAVVFVLINLDPGSAACTGTLISPRVVLTAAHCLCDDQGNRRSAERIAVYFGNSTESWYAQRAVDEVREHPDYDPDWRSGAPKNDIGLIRLSTAAPSSVVPIAPLPASMGLTEADVGGDLDYVGFGLTETGSHGTRLHVLNGLDLICEASNGCRYPGGGIAAPHTICSDQDPGGTCRGDSGGPAFRSRGAVEYVVGVTSYGDGNCTWFSCSTKVDSFEGFIADFVSKENGAACTSDSACQSGQCVDGVCCESACDGLCHACNLPGRLGSCGPVLDGTACADEDPCNGAETCQSGICQSATPLVCDDHNACTADSCKPNTGCQHLPLPDESPCGTCLTCRNAACEPVHNCVIEGSACAATDGRPSSPGWLLALGLGLWLLIRRTN